jgi:F-type H+-transporting ATPase subunit gamma
MASGKDIQRRIKSIGNTKKITKAMEMVAASKMRKAIEAVLKTRTYANLSWATVVNLSQASKNGELHPLLKKRDKTEKVAIILITSNRGLCGSYNSALINKAEESIRTHFLEDGKTTIPTDYLLIGKKGEAVYRFFKHDIAAEFPKEDLVLSVKEVIPIAKMMISDYLSKKYDKILVAYTDFVSASKQIPRVKQLLPIVIDSSDDYLGIVGQDTRLGIQKDFISKKEEKYLKTEKYTYEYTFEPSPREVLDEMIPRLLEIQLFQAMLESNASEHSARMSAMHQATDAAGDLVNELTLFYNKARQASITAELAEISAGANALNAD